MYLVSNPGGVTSRCCPGAASPPHPSCPQRCQHCPVPARSGLWGSCSSLPRKARVSTQAQGRHQPGQYGGNFTVQFHRGPVRHQPMTLSWAPLPVPRRAAAHRPPPSVTGLAWAAAGTQAGSGSAGVSEGGPKPLQDIRQAGAIARACLQHRDGLRGAGDDVLHAEQRLHLRQRHVAGQVTAGGRGVAALAHPNSSPARPSPCLGGLRRPSQPRECSKVWLLPPRTRQASLGVTQWKGHRSHRRPSVCPHPPG